LVEYYEHLLEFCPQELYPARRIKPAPLSRTSFPQAAD
jgi:hypothetical protein